MTLDKSLRVRRGLLRSRSVLTRAERLTQLQENDRWKAGDPPVGLPKVRVFKLSMKKKKKKKEEEGADGAAAPAAGDKKAGDKKADAGKKPEAKKPEAKKK
jgi:small basic protein (TIGR04137 family)